MVLLLCCIGLLTGCQVTQSEFERTAGDAGSTFAAAATMLDYAHQGKFTKVYAHSSFENFRSQLDGLDQQLPTLTGLSDKQMLQSLLHAYKAAMPAIRQPCLDDTCDWRAQLTSLQGASKAFLRAGGQ